MSSDTKSTIEQANDELRQAIRQRRAAVAAGKPAEEWYTDDSLDEIAAERSPMAASLAGCQPALEAATAALSGGCCEGVRRPDAAAGFQAVVEAARPARLARETHPSSQAFYDLCDSLKDMHRAKSADYGSTDDPLANIRNGAEFVGIEHWRGAMVRLSDKVTRLATYCRTGRLEHEGVEDTLLDLASYSLLALLLHRESRDG